MIHNHKLTDLSQPAADVEENRMIVLSMIKDKWNRIAGILLVVCNKAARYDTVL